MAGPFLKWAGGKGRLAARVMADAPGEFGRYHEPFAGGGALFFAFASKGRICSARLTDSNQGLIECYSVVRDEPRELIGALHDIEERYLAGGEDERKAFYYAQRAARPRASIERVARFIFLNRTCYNGLYRENSSGAFNVPHGRYVRPRICDTGGIEAASAALQGVDLTVEDFDEACAAAGPGDFVYLDPPYHPLTATARFTSYTAASFGEPEQRRLAAAFDAMTSRGVRAMLSNSDHPFIRALYEGKGYRLAVVTMSRAINSKGALRSPIPELLIANFGENTPTTP